MNGKVKLIVNVGHILCLNVGSEKDKISRKKGTTLYLTEEEADYVRFNYPDSLENGVFYFEGEEIELNEAKETGKLMNIDDKAEFFKLHTNSAKAKIKKIDDTKLIDELIDYANDNEIEGKVVDALVKRYNELMS